MTAPRGRSPRGSQPRWLCWELLRRGRKVIRSRRHSGVVLRKDQLIVQLDDRVVDAAVLQNVSRCIQNGLKAHETCVTTKRANVWKACGEEKLTTWRWRYSKSRKRCTSSAADRWSITWNHLRSGFRGVSMTLYGADGRFLYHDIAPSCLERPLGELTVRSPCEFSRISTLRCT